MKFSDHHLASIATKDVLPHIFKRSLFTVSSDDTLADVGLYLALEGRIYFDGFPVRFGDTLVGRIASYFVIKHALKSNSKE